MNIYPIRPAARNTDPLTSHEAADSVDHPTHMRRVFGWIKLNDAPFTRLDVQNAMRTHMSESSARSRVSELLDAEYLLHGGYRTIGTRRHEVLHQSTLMQQSVDPPEIRRTTKDDRKAEVAANQRQAEVLSVLYFTAVRLGYADELKEIVGHARSAGDIR